MRVRSCSGISYIFQVSWKSVEGYRSCGGLKIAFSHWLVPRLYTTACTTVHHCRYGCRPADILRLKCSVMLANVSWTLSCTHSALIDAFLKVCAVTSTAMLKMIWHKQDWHIPAIRVNLFSFLDTSCKIPHCLDVLITVIIVDSSFCVIPLTYYVSLIRTKNEKQNK